MVTSNFNLNYYVDQLPVEIPLNLNSCHKHRSQFLSPPSISITVTQLRSQFLSNILNFDPNSYQPKFDISSCKTNKLNKLWSRLASKFISSFQSIISIKTKTFFFISPFRVFSFCKHIVWWSKVFRNIFLIEIDIRFSCSGSSSVIFLSKTDLLILVSFNR